MSNFMSIETHGGEPINHGEITLTPFAQSLIIRFPGLPGGFIWNRPVSVLAVHTDGREQVIPIPDVTRQVQWALLGATLAMAILPGLVSRIIRKQKRAGSSL